jgi:Bacterial proteasome activator
MSTSEGGQASSADRAPSEAERATEQARLATRLEELFHSIQTTLFAQEMAAQQQLQSIADVWAATDRYRVAGHGQIPAPIPVERDRPLASDSEPVGS